MVGSLFACGDLSFGSAVLVDMAVIQHIAGSLPCKQPPEALQPHGTKGSRTVSVRMHINFPTGDDWGLPPLCADAPNHTPSRQGGHAHGILLTLSRMGWCTPLLTKVMPMMRMSSGTARSAASLLARWISRTRLHACKHAVERNDPRCMGQADVLAWKQARGQCLACSTSTAQVPAVIGSACIVSLLYPWPGSAPLLRSRGTGGVWRAQQREGPRGRPALVHADQGCHHAVWGAERCCCCCLRARGGGLCSHSWGGRQLHPHKGST